MNPAGDSDSRSPEIPPDVPPADAAVDFGRDDSVDRAVTRAVREDLARHALKGNLVVVWRDGRPVLVPAARVTSRS